VWEVVNELSFKKKRNSTVPSKLITAAGDTITDQQTIPEEFNDYFVNVGNKMANSITPMSNSTNSNLTLCSLTTKAKTPFFCGQALHKKFMI